MKNFLFSALIASTLFAAPAVAQRQLAANTPKKIAKAATTYKVQPEASKLTWLGKKVTGQHNGAVGIKEGTLLAQGSQVTGGTLVVDMNTITNADLADAEYNGKLVGHLKSEDFFGVEKNPTATFKITKVTPLKKADEAGNNATVAGDLTIKGITKPVSFPAKVAVAGGVVTAKGTATVDRTLYGIRYGSGSFFDNLGDKAIDNNFALTFDVTAK